MGGTSGRMRASSCWLELPEDMKLDCLRFIDAEAALAVAATSSEAQKMIFSDTSEDLWAEYLSNDHGWICLPGLTRETSSRQRYVSLTKRSKQDGFFLVYGGIVRRDQRQRHADVSAVSSLSRSHDGELRWQSHTLPTRGRCAAGTCQAGGQMFSVGGFDFSEEVAVSDVEVIDIASLAQGRVEIKALPRLRYPRACPALVATPEALLAIGGGSSMFTAAETFASVEALPLCDLQSEWRPVPSLQLPRCAAGACTTGTSQVYVVSGYGGKDRYEESVEWMDASSDEGLLRGWQPAPALAHARAGCVACSGPDRCVWALGGGRNESESLDTVERLDPRIGSWFKDVPSMPGRRRCFAGGFGLDRKLYIYGGWDSSRWHDPTAARLDLRMLKWELLPLFKGEVDGVIPYHFVSGCVAC